MNKSRAQNRFYNSWVDIVLTVVSIIQGLAFNDLVVRLPNIYDYTVAKNDFQLIASFIFSFVILIRLFQTYVTAALDYDEWSVNFFDIFLIFIIGAVEYFVFSALVTEQFDIREFHTRVSIISILGIVGYLGAILRLKEELFPSYFDYRKEIQLQSVNITGVILVQAISTYIIFAPPQAAWIYTIGGLISAAILSFNVYYSLKTTFSPSIQIKLIDNLNENSQELENQTQREIIIKPASRDNLLGLLDLLIDNFGYVYESIFDTSPRLTKSILKEVLQINDGDHALGYKSFYITIDKLTGSCVGVMMFNSEKTRKTARVFITLTTTLFIVFKHLGFWGIFRSLSNVRAASTAMPIDIPNELHITYFAVSKEYQQMGIGHQMMEYAKGIAKSEGKRTIALDTRENNTSARQFFKSQGFIADSIINSDSDKAFGHGARIHMKLSL
jgi:ribosomal protein S18 acetylase RimI-like enzyme